MGVVRGDVGDVDVHGVDGHGGYLGSEQLVQDLLGVLADFVGDGDDGLGVLDGDLDGDPGVVVVPVGVDVYPAGRGGWDLGDGVAEVGG